MFFQIPFTFAQHPPVFEGMTIDSSRFQVSDLALNLVKYSYGGSNVRFLTIHDDEDTGVKAAFDYIQINGGSIVDCQYGSVRNFRFTFETDTYQVDPNSIYTKEGVKLGLEKYSEIVSNRAMRLLMDAGEEILRVYNHKDHGYFITLHNNADGGFGISSYLKGYELESTADSVHINFEMDNDDLIYVTDLRLFNYIKKQNVNVILQSKNALNDGSMSVYAQKHHIPYINVEVQHGHRDEHLRLLSIAVEAMRAIGKIKDDVD
ncbi:hypothetical protein C7T94_06625 [Pedobacter yulinensis]|uniref:Uncharacterized protein n=2 Tax=Pedobacter yulinensis TaxID=2126353 RepID=A0A2T3HQ05_9SPHI|nr:hypothetical protein C7T94_06625 [Pedobacter yulinensis]